VREHLDPVKFIERHNNVGDPNPAERKGLIDSRRARLAKAKTRQERRVSRICKAEMMLARQAHAILNG